MKMLCIRGRQRAAWHNGLYSGRVYEVEYANCFECGRSPHALAEGSRFHRPTAVHCTICGALWIMTLVPWGRARFVPWAEPKVSLSEVERLYQPSDLKEKV